MLAGPPPPPVHLNYNLEETCNSTHVPTTISWSTERGSQEEDLQYLLSITEADELLEIDYFTTRNTNTISIFLQYDVAYTVALVASRCDFKLNSSSVVIKVPVPPYQCKYAT